MRDNKKLATPPRSLSTMKNRSEESSDSFFVSEGFGLVTMSNRRISPLSDLQKRPCYRRYLLWLFAPVIKLSFFVIFDDCFCRRRGIRIRYLDAWANSHVSESFIRKKFREKSGKIRGMYIFLIRSIENMKVVIKSIRYVRW